ncbi:DUF1573 domain-containing protein [Bacteroides congonensis]|uniref:DUF1573 domain-containing protein n=1 Tax=Bacteroides congonensis TaxID=1871006 RepID=UPI0023F91826|nr:DUF1573 domain-containing protein [Bacteroides congonensis]
MKKHLITFFLLLCLTIVYAQEKAELVFQKETIELGKIHTEKEHDEIITNFVFYNKGNKPLVIYKVTAACGCTIPSWPKTPIKVGEKSTIKVVFKTKGQKGVFSKKLFVESNSQSPIKLLKIKGEIK